MGCVKSKSGYRLTREDLEDLKANTSFEESAIKEWYKRFKQDCPNGQMNSDEFVGMYKMFFPGGNAEQFCEYAFRTKKGYLDFKEFILAIDMTNAGTAEEKLKVAFRMYDLDGNGELDLDEIHKIVEDIYARPCKLGAKIEKPTKSAEATAMDIFEQIDENGDGTITEEKFLTGCLEDEKLFKMLVPNVFK